MSLRCLSSSSTVFFCAGGGKQVNALNDCDLSDMKIRSLKWLPGALRVHGDVLKKNPLGEQISLILSEVSTRYSVWIETAAQHSGQA